MKIMIQSQGTLAIYEQIVSQIKNEIIKGSLVPGEVLPSIRALASQLHISVITTKRAYEELEKEGLIRSVAGKGFYVCESNKDYLREKQLIMIEERLFELIAIAKGTGVSKEELIEMVGTLYRGSGIL